jgi:Mor family transcriptional regulator
MIDIKNIQEEDLNTCYRDVAKVLGLEATLKLGKELGGETYFLPKLKSNEKCMTLEEFDSLPPKYWRYKDIAKVIGPEATLKLAKEFGGETFYLSKPDGPRGILSKIRDRIILEELKTHSGSVIQLARKYGVTSRWVYYIIQRATKITHDLGSCPHGGGKSAILPRSKERKND